MPETTVCTNLLQPLQVITELRVDTVGQDLRVLAVNDVPLPVQEPRGDLELSGVLDDGDDALEFIRVEVTGTVGTKTQNIGGGREKQMGGSSELGSTKSA